MKTLVYASLILVALASCLNRSTPGQTWHPGKPKAPASRK
ncbi:MAG: hypothetical protein RLZZ175_897 [Bacteroidota bacterium]|jgi:hypothetical protein